MPGLKLKVTTAGRAALVNPPNTGTNAVLVSHVGIASAPFVASAELTALPNEIKRIAGVGGTITADDTIHVSIRDESTSVYDCYGFGLYLSDGTLFAVYSQNDLLLGKAGAAMMLLALDAVFVDIDATQISFGATNFIDPAATTEVPGIVELATETEATTGADKVRAITAYLLKKVLDVRLGAGAPSDFVKGLLGLTTAALFRAQLEIKGAALKDEGDGKGLDADKLDGKHAIEFAATVHPHAISDITGLSAALAATWNTDNFDPGTKYDKAGGTISGPVLINLGALGTDAGAIHSDLTLRGSSGNLDYLESQYYRKTAGNAWTTAAWRISRRVDATRHGYVEFPGSDTGKELAFGFGNTDYCFLASDGSWVFNGPVSAGSIAISTNRGLLYQSEPATGTVSVRAGTAALGDRYFSFSGSTGEFSALNGGGSFSGVVKATRVSLSGQDGAVLQCTFATGNTMYMWGKAGSGDNMGYITYNGSSNYTFNWNGAVMASGGYQPLSSRDLKTALRANPYGLASVLQLETYLGKYRKWFNPDGRERVFLIAENIAEVMPQVAGGDGITVRPPRARQARQFKGYAIEQMLPVLVKAIQDLHGIVQAQGERIAELEKEH